MRSLEQVCIDVAFETLLEEEYLEVMNTDFICGLSRAQDLEKGQIIEAKKGLKKYFPGRFRAINEKNNRITKRRRNIL